VCVSECPSLDEDRVVRDLRDSGANTFRYGRALEDPFRANGFVGRGDAWRLG
jgi:hypothetical protein